MIFALQFRFFDLFFAFFKVSRQSYPITTDLAIQTKVFIEINNRKYGNNQVNNNMTGWNFNLSGIRPGFNY